MSEKQRSTSLGGYFARRELGLYYLQSRYYNPTWGRFINADALVSTGQGILGNNMFAYCLNNPVNFLDSEGSSAICVTNGDRNPLMIGHIGLGGGGGGGCGGYAGGGSNHYKDIFEELDAIKDKTLDAVGSFAGECLDAYMRSQNVQQEAQLQQAIAINEFVADRFSTLQKAGNTCTLVGSGILFGVSVDAIGKAAAAGTALGGPICGAIGAFVVFVGAICYTMAEE